MTWFLPLINMDIYGGHTDIWMKSLTLSLSMVLVKYLLVLFPRRIGDYTAVYKFTKGYQTRQGNGIKMRFQRLAPPSHSLLAQGQQTHNQRN